MGSLAKANNELVARRNATLIAAEAKKLGVPAESFRIVHACDFCGIDQIAAKLLIAGRAVMPDVEVHICDQCVAVCADIVAEQAALSSAPEGGS